MITTAAELDGYLKSMYVVDEESLGRKPLDRIVIGDPETKIKKIGTTWMPYFSTIKAAYEQGVNVLIVHEPTFYTYGELEEHQEEFSWAADSLGLYRSKNEYLQMREEKKQWILDHNMVIIRCHDMMDRIKDIGMPFALGDALGFDRNDIVRETMMFHVYKIQPDKAINVTKGIAAKLKALHQPGVHFYGDENREVTTVGVGTGCACDPIRYGELQADLHIAINDTIRTWLQPVFAEDSGKPLVVIDHGTSEEAGMVNLCNHLKEAFPTMECTHFSQGCSYKWIEG